MTSIRDLLIGKEVKLTITQEEAKKMLDRTLKLNTVHDFLHREHVEPINKTSGRIVIHSYQILIPTNERVWFEMVDSGIDDDLDT